MMSLERLRHIADWFDGLDADNPAAELRQLADELESRSFQEKIFSHKHLDPKCVESGCQSLALELAQRRSAELELSLRQLLYQSKDGSWYVVTDPSTIDRASAVLREPSK